MHQQPNWGHHRGTAGRFKGIDPIRGRPPGGNDRRYAVDPTKLETELVWKPQYTFDTGFIETIDWYWENETGGGL